MISEDKQHWLDDISSEIKSLEDHETWSIIAKPNNVNTISARWIFKTKVTPDGKIDRYKARLIARGYSQKPGVDYFQVYASVIRNETIRILFALATQFDMNIIQFDKSPLFGAQHNGCLFHYAQIVTRSVVTHGLKKLYSSSVEFAEQVRKIIALAFLNPDEVEQQFENIALGCLMMIMSNNFWIASKQIIL